MKFALNLLHPLRFYVVIMFMNKFSFMDSHGIINQSSCSHTPQHNGMAEHKNRHLVETACTVLIHAHMLFPFWGDAILTTF